MMIRALTVPSKYQSLIPQTWENIPDLAVITGLNGAGKSQLLEAIDQTIQNTGTRNVKPLQIDNAGQLKGKHKYVKTDFAPGDIHNRSEQQNPIVRLEQRRARQKVGPHHQPLVDEIKAKLGDTLDTLDDQELIGSFPLDLPLRMQDSFDNSYIAEVFKDYQARIDRYKLNIFHNQCERPSEKKFMR